MKAMSRVCSIAPWHPVRAWIADARCPGGDDAVGEQIDIDIVASVPPTSPALG